VDWKQELFFLNCCRISYRPRALLASWATTLPEEILVQIY